jgi:HlyD family secretion protein
LKTGHPGKEVVPMTFKKKELADGAAPSRKGRKKWLKWAILAAILLAAGIFVFRSCKAGQEALNAMAAAAYHYDAAVKQDINVSLTGTGTLQPADSYEVNAMVTGEILNAPFEEGDVLEEGALLYEIDPSDAQNNIDRAEISLERSRMGYDQTAENLEKLQIKANRAGYLTSLTVEPGDEVQAGQAIGSIQDSSVMVLRVPFNSADAANLSLGGSALVTPSGSFESLPGVITKIDSTDTAMAGGMLVRYLEIEVENPGGLSGGGEAFAEASGLACNSAGTFSYKAETPVTAGISGKVASIAIQEGGWADKDSVILTLESKDLQKSLKDSELALKDGELSLQNQRDQLEDYRVTSPIAGTVVQKSYKAGDNLTASGSRALCTIYDLSYLTMDLNIDELDISKLKVGQKVAITADAVEGRVYEGTITKISVQGSTSGGVTTYPVTIQIDETDGLLPGMNVDAEILVDSVSDVLAVPAAAVQRGDRVLVAADSETGKAALEADPEGAAAGAPEGYVWAKVTLGLSSDRYVEIVGGLSEGDAIAYPANEGGGFFFGGNGMMVEPDGAMPMGDGGTVTYSTEWR